MLRQERGKQAIALVPLFSNFAIDKGENLDKRSTRTLSSRSNAFVKAQVSTKPASTSGDLVFFHDQIFDNHNEIREARTNLVHISRNTLGTRHLAGSGMIDKVRRKEGFDKGEGAFLENLCVELLHEYSRRS